LDRGFSVEFEVVPSSPQLRVTNSTGVEIMRPVVVEVRAESAIGSTAAIKYPEKLVATLPNGSNIDLTATGTGVYTGSWTPDQVGQAVIHVAAAGDSRIEPLDLVIQVFGRVEFGAIPPIRIGPVRGGGQADALLDVSAAKVYGSVNLD